MSNRKLKGQEKVVIINGLREVRSSAEMEGYALGEEKTKGRNTPLSIMGRICRQINKEIADLLTD